MNVLFVAAEADPFVKVGGLGDVAGTLPHALLELPSPPDIRLVIPFHPQIDRTQFPYKQIATFEVRNQLMATVYLAIENGLPVYLIGGEPITESSAVYSSDTNADGRKYIFFSLAVIELMKILDWMPDVLHAHDWHTAPVIYGLSLSQENSEFSKIKTLLTIHNLPYLGIGAEKMMEQFGLPPLKNGLLPEWAQQTPLPVGLMMADRINTVSPGYAEEILTEPFGSGLHEELKTRSKDISGVLNGLDLEAWNPYTDKVIAKKFNIENIEIRPKNKKALLNDFGLPYSDEVPVFGIVSRMDYQKGIDIAIQALEEIVDKNWQAVILGTGDPKIEEQAERFAKKYPARVRLVLRYDERIARQIYAGADMLLIPSRYEPCGLTQMIAMRYGCVPVANSVGGLKDTIKPYNEKLKGGIGFLAVEQTLASFIEVMEKGLDAFQDKRRWKGLQRRGMQQNFSWGKSAQEYLKLYEDVCK